MKWGDRKLIGEPDWRRLVETRLKQLLRPFWGQPITPELREEIKKVMVEYLKQMYPDTNVQVETNEDTGEITVTWDEYRYKAD